MNSTRASRRGKGRSRSSPSQIFRIGVPDGLGNPRWVTADLVDHSDAGIGVSLRTPLSVGTRITLRGKLGEGKSGWDIECQAHVAWCLEKLDGSYRAGLEFEDGAADFSFEDGATPPTSAAEIKEDHYEVLQLSPNADSDTIHRVYRLLAQRFHPDNADTGNEERFKKVLEAHRILGDPERRVAYDVQWRAHQRLRWKIFDQPRAAVGLEAERRKREGILSLLYTKRMNQPEQPALTIHALEDLLGCPREHLQFSLWYLKEKAYIQRSDSGRYSITASGVEHVERNGVIEAAATRMITSGQPPADE